MRLCEKQQRFLYTLYKLELADVDDVDKMFLVKFIVAEEMSKGMNEEMKNLGGMILNGYGDEPKY